MDKVLKTAKRLHDLGFGILWLREREKKPIPSQTGWAQGKRFSWERLLREYRPGMNLGTRTGEGSCVGGNYLACIDVDIHSLDYREVALRKLKELVGDKILPEVRSGWGNGSRHLYCVTKETFSQKTIAKEKNKWEIVVYSNGRQMVLPPSIHPDTGKHYEWIRPIENVGSLPVFDFKAEEFLTPESKPLTADFKISNVELEWLDISDEMRAAIVEGRGVSDRSAFLLRATSALFSAGLNRNEVLTVLTEPEYFLGKTGYEHAQTGSRKKAADWVFKYSVLRVEKDRNPAAVFSSSLKQPESLTEEEISAQEKEINALRSWTQDLERSGKNGEGPPKGTIQNVVLILKNDISPFLLKRDTFAYRDTYGISAPWGADEGNLATDDDVARIRHWLGVEWGFEPRKEILSDALTVIACENAFDPILDFVEALPDWDGKSRLGGWLARYFGARGNPHYLAEVFTKWVVAMILRVYEPGAKFDWMPIFEGPQGAGKSSFGRLLCGEKYFNDWLPNLADKDAALALQGNWCVEMGELSQFRKNELEVIKGFITRTVDKVRPPYGRKTVESKRRCVFFGTTNHETYLRDETGNRRLKPVKVGKLNFKALERDRLQIFAEAKFLYETFSETEETLSRFSKPAWEYEQHLHQIKMVHDDSTTMIEVLAHYFENSDNVPDFDLEKFSIIEMFSPTGPLNRWRLDNRNMQFASKALRKLGFEKRTIRGRNFWRKTPSFF